MAGWQYTIERVTVAERWSSMRQAEEIKSFEDSLNEYGRDNWEMVSFQTVPLTGSFSGNIKGYMYLAIFKRPAG